MPVQINELAITRPTAPGTPPAAADAGEAALAGLATLVRILRRKDLLSSIECREIADEVTARLQAQAWQFP